MEHISVRKGMLIIIFYTHYPDGVGHRCQSLVTDVALNVLSGSIQIVFSYRLLVVPSSTAHFSLHSFIYLSARININIYIYLFP